MFGIFESALKTVTTVAVDVVSGAVDVAEAVVNTVGDVVHTGIEVVKEVRDDLQDATK